MILSVARDGGTTPDDTIYDFDLVLVSCINADRYYSDLFVVMQERIERGVCKRLRSLSEL